MNALDDIKVHVRYTLAALWTSVMFCYVYGDYFDLYRPDKLQGMLDGQMGPLGAVTQGVLLGTSILMAVPSLMIFLSVALPPALCRWLNIAAGVFYSAIMLLIAVSGGWLFYTFLALIEATLTSLVVWYAWRWPRSKA